MSVEIQKIVRARVGRLNRGYVLYVEDDGLKGLIGREVVVYIDGLKLRLRPRYGQYYSGGRVYMRLPKALDDLWARYYGSYVDVIIEVPG